MIYSCPPSTPKPALRSQSGMLDSKHRIWLEKLGIVARIFHRERDKENYARDILKEQLEHGWTGLITEVAEICQRVGLPNVCETDVNREKVEEAMVNHHLLDIKKEMEPLSKLNKMRNQNTRVMQSHTKERSLENSRMKFLWETKMIDTRMNMKGRYKKDKYQCPHCIEGSKPGGSLETSEQLMSCTSYADLREGKNPELVMEDRVSYLRKVIKRRKELEQLLRSGRPVDSD